MLKKCTVAFNAHLIHPWSDREHLASALRLYKMKLGSQHPVVIETLSTLSYLSVKVGEWDQAKSYLEEAQSLLQQMKKGVQGMDPSVSHMQKQFV